jgi:Flp pilus assembly protein TadB
MARYMDRFRLILWGFAAVVLLVAILPTTPTQSAIIVACAFIAAILLGAKVFAKPNKKKEREFIQILRKLV